MNPSRTIIIKTHKLTYTRALAIYKKRKKEKP